MLFVIIILVIIDRPKHPLHDTRGNSDRALPLLEQALSIRQEVLPAGHPDTLSTQRSLEAVRGMMN